MTRLEDGEKIEGVIINLIGNGIISLFSLVSAFTLLFIYDLNLALIYLVTIPINILLLLKMNKTITGKERIALVWHAKSNSQYLDAMTGIDTIKSFKSESFFNQQLGKAFHTYKTYVQALEITHVKFNVLISAVSLIAGVSIISVASIRVINNALELGNLIAIISISTIATASANSLVEGYLDYIGSKVAFERMADLFHNRAKESTTRKADQNKDQKSSIRSISLTEVSFSFPGRVATLNQLNMSINRGSLTVVLGESGSGKTTMMNLIQGTLPLKKGVIEVTSDEEGNSTLIEKVRFGVVPQDVKVFNASLWKNISMSDNIQDRARVVSLLEELQLDFLIKNLPESYDTLLGEDGVKLSGGEKKYLAFARALYINPEVLLLDELTSSLDRKNKKHIDALVNSLKVKVPILMISHDVIVASKADYIYIIENGKITDHGAPSSLNAYSNFYSDFFSQHSFS